MSRFPQVTFAALSDIGRKRKNNEDACGAFPSFGLWVVSDGMGGGDDGEVASAATVRSLADFVNQHPFPDGGTWNVDDLVSGIERAVCDTSAWIYARAKEKHLKGCGATFVALLLDASHPDEGVALHAGDSRLYRIRGRGIQQITKDHSAAAMIGAKNEADINPMFRGMVLRAVGVQPTVELERTAIPIKPGDWVLICSDGLSRMVDDRKIVSIVRDAASPDDGVRNLIAAANAAGGIDNITAVLVQFGETPVPLPSYPLALEERDSDVALSPAQEDGVTRDTGEAESMTFGTPSSADTTSGIQTESMLNFEEAAEEDGQEPQTLTTVAGFPMVKGSDVAAATKPATAETAKPATAETAKPATAETAKPIPAKPATEKPTPAKPATSEADKPAVEEPSARSLSEGGGRRVSVWVIAVIAALVGALVALGAFWLSGSLYVGETSEKDAQKSANAVQVHSCWTGCGRI